MCLFESLCLKLRELRRLYFIRRVRLPVGIADLFDDEEYRNRVFLKSKTQSALEHYFLIGESIGVRPNPYFDPNWYSEAYPDVKAAGVSPLGHYARHGWREGRNPSPDFHTNAYLLLYPDVARAGIDPLGHYLGYGRAEGRSAIPVSAVQRQLSGVIPPQQPLGLEWIEDDTFNTIYAEVGRLCADAGPISAILALPVFGRGGAEKVALSFSRVLEERYHGRTMLILVTDGAHVDETIEVPSSVRVFRLFDYIRALPMAARKRILFRCLQAFRPRLFHVINSDLAWQLLDERGDTVTRMTKVFGSLFCVQRDYDTKEPIGFAFSYFGTAQKHCQAILSDNEFFWSDVKSILPPQEKDRPTFTIYNPVHWREAAAQPAATLLSTVSGARPRVLWAGRIDRQKRIELLYDTAERMPECDFHVFGSSVTDNLAVPSTTSNVTFRGPFKSINDVLINGPFDLYMHTTYEEGLPNILLEIGMAGVPIVAPKIGGIPELIHDATGFLLPTEASATDYRDAILAITSNPEEARRRAARLRDLIGERHNWQAFQARVSDVPGYLT